MNYILVHEKPTGRATLINLDNVVWFGREEDGSANVWLLGFPQGYSISESFDEIQDMISNLKRRNKRE